MEGNQIERRPPGMDQFIWQLLDQKILVIGLGRDIEQFFQVLFDTEHNIKHKRIKIKINTKPNARQKYMVRNKI